MTNEIPFITYQEMLSSIEGHKNNHLLLGNGFNCSLGICTTYKAIFNQMKINNREYESIIGENFDLEEFIGSCKSKIIKENNTNYDFMTTFFHNKIKLDFMKAVTQIVSKDVKNIFKEKNEKIYLLLKNFDNFFTLNYDPFLYQLLMSYKKEDLKEKKALAFTNTLPFVKELMQEEDKKLYDIISQAYESGNLTVVIPNNPKKTNDLNQLKKSEFIQAVNNYLKDKNYTKQQIKRIVDKIWEQKNEERRKFIEKLDDGFGLFGDDLVFRHPETQNLFFLHGAFHIYKRGKSVYKIAQSTEKALYQRIEDIVDNHEENILCIFSDKNKISEVQSDEYYLNCFNKLAELEGSLVVIGCAFSDNDSHIFKQIQNSKINRIYVTCFSSENDKFSKKLRKFFPKKELKLVDVETITYN